VSTKPPSTLVDQISTDITTLGFTPLIPLVFIICGMWIIGLFILYMISLYFLEIIGSLLLTGPVNESAVAHGFNAIIFQIFMIILTFGLGTLLMASIDIFKSEFISGKDSDEGDDHIHGVFISPGNAISTVIYWLLGLLIAVGLVFVVAIDVIERPALVFDEQISVFLLVVAAGFFIFNRLRGLVIAITGQGFVVSTLFFYYCVTAVTLDITAYGVQGISLIELDYDFIFIPSGVDEVAEFKPGLASMYMPVIGVLLFIDGFNIVDLNHVYNMASHLLFDTETGDGYDLALVFGLIVLPNIWLAIRTMVAIRDKIISGAKYLILLRPCS